MKRKKQPIAGKNYRSKGTAASMMNMCESIDDVRNFIWATRNRSAALLSRSSLRRSTTFPIGSVN
jgi:hypothetical protein